MPQTTNVNIPINRVEGDLEVQVTVEDGVVTKARSIGTMFRGFEALMLGRSALDGLVITPRICGICSLSHLNAAAEALDAISGTRPPDNALRLRNIALMAETVQNDIRHHALMFMADFAHRQAYGKAPFFAEALRRYAPMQGDLTHEVIKETKRLPQIVAIIGGQWPHTSFMVPGGVASNPDMSRLLQCSMIVQQFRAWYERQVLGCTIQRWQQIKSRRDLEQWLGEHPSHGESEVGFLLRCLQEANIGHLGRGPNCFLAYGNYTLPLETAVSGTDGRLLAAGFAEGNTIHPFDQGCIREDVSHGWFESAESPLHPAESKTEPKMDGPGRDATRYSWVKAPRYAGKVAETGPLAEMLLNGNPLFQDLVTSNGPNVLSRQLARLTRTAGLLPIMSTWLEELVTHTKESFYTKVDTIPDGEGAGLIHAARGALGHWVRIRDQKIVHYQIITPTAWNGSPRDETGRPGAWEQALIGTPITDASNPIEAGHVIRSFDPCMVCAVHTIAKSKRQ